MTQAHMMAGEVPRRKPALSGADSPAGEPAPHPGAAPELLRKERHHARSNLQNPLTDSTSLLSSLACRWISCTA